MASNLEDAYSKFLAMAKQNGWLGDEITTGSMAPRPDDPGLIRPTDGSMAYSATPLAAPNAVGTGSYTREPGAYNPLVGSEVERALTMGQENIPQSRLDAYFQTLIEQEKQRLIQSGEAKDWSPEQLHEVASQNMTRAHVDKNKKMPKVELGLHLQDIREKMGQNDPDTEYLLSLLNTPNLSEAAGSMTRQGHQLIPEPSLPGANADRMNAGQYGSTMMPPIVAETTITKKSYKDPASVARKQPPPVGKPSMVATYRPTAHSSGGQKRTEGYESDNAGSSKNKVVIQGTNIRSASLPIDPRQTQNLGPYGSFNPRRPSIAPPGNAGASLNALNWFKDQLGLFNQSRRSGPGIQNLGPYGTFPR